MRLGSVSGISPTARQQLEKADRENFKTNRDNYQGDGRLILTSPNGTLYSVEVDNAGNLSTSAV